MAAAPVGKVLGGALRWIVLAALPVGIVLGGVAVYGTLAAQKQAPRQAAAEARVPQVDVLTLEPRAITADIVGYGTVRPQRQAVLNAGVGGNVVEVHPALKVGSFVEAGDVLARIDPTDYGIARSAAEADLQQAEAEITRLRSLGTALEATRELQARSVELAEQDYGRKQELVKRGTVTQVNAEQALQVLIEQRVSLAGTNQQVEVLPAQIRQAEAAAAKARSQLDRAEADLARTVIAAPFDAQVVAADVSIAGFVPAGAPVATLADVARYEIVINVEQERMGDLPAVPAGTLPPELRDLPGIVGEPEATIQWLGYSGQYRWRGRLTRIEPLDPATRTLPLVVEVDAPWESLRTGQAPPLASGFFCRVTIEGERDELAMVVPQSAVHEGDTVHLLRDGRLAVERVRVFRRLGDDLVVFPAPAPVDVGVTVTLPGVDLPARKRVADDAARALAELARTKLHGPYLYYNRVAFGVEEEGEDGGGADGLDALRGRVSDRLASLVPQGDGARVAVEPNGTMPSFWFGDRIVLSPLAYATPGMRLEPRPVAAAAAVAGSSAPRAGPPAR